MRANDFSTTIAVQKTRSNRNWVMLEHGPQKTIAVQKTRPNRNAYASVAESPFARL